MFKVFSLFLGLFATVAFANDNPIYGTALLENIANYEKDGTISYANWFVLLQSKYFAPAFFAVLFGVIVAFATHFAIIGPKVFPHDGPKIKIFSKFQRFIRGMTKPHTL